MYTYERERRWYGGNKTEVGRKDGRPVVGHKHKPIIHCLCGTGRRDYLMDSDNGEGRSDKAELR